MKINKFYMPMFAVVLVSSLSTFCVETAVYNTEEEQKNIIDTIANTTITKAPVTVAVDTPEIRALSSAMTALSESKAAVNEASRKLAGATPDSKSAASSHHQKALADHKKNIAEANAKLNQVKGMINADSKVA